MSHASFNIVTASKFLEDLRKYHPAVIPHVTEKSENRLHSFWQKNPKAMLMNSWKNAEQKLDYSHDNPLDERWNLAKSPEEYKWSSANFYLAGKDKYSILTHYIDFECGVA